MRLQEGELMPLVPFQGEGETPELCPSCEARPVSRASAGTDPACAPI